MSKQHNYYQILHVQPDAPDEVIKSTYRTLMQRMRLHPDLGGSHSGATLINEAFRTLGDPARRAEYDRMLNTPDERPTETVEPAPPSECCAFCGSPEPPYETDTDRICVDCGAALAPATRHHGDSSCRRAMERLPRYMRISYARSKDTHTLNKGITQDISPDGMRVLTNVRMAIGERVMIDCEFCAAVGLVRNMRLSRTDDEVAWEYGIEFLRIRLKHQRGGLLHTRV